MTTQHPIPQRSTPQEEQQEQESWRPGVRAAALYTPPAVATPQDCYVLLYTVPGTAVLTPEAALDTLEALLTLEGDLRAIVANEEEQRVEELRQRAQ